VAAAAAEAETARVAEEERLVAEEHQMSFTGNAKQDKPRMTIQDCHTIATFQRIIAEKVVEFVRSQGHRVMHAHVLKYLGVLGVNKMCAALENKYKVSPVQMVSEAFAAFDLNHDGQISKSELESVLCSVRFGRHVGAKAVGSLMSKLDVDMDGLISLDEFKTYALAAPYKAKSGESAKCSTRWAIQRQHR
jgi:Ca2+-binding EF-hand superfamily protein